MESGPLPGWLPSEWPNDVLIDGRKLCGILSERIVSEAGVAVVIGMGSTPA